MQIATAPIATQLVSLNNCGSQGNYQKQKENSDYFLLLRNHEIGILEL